MQTLGLYLFNDSLVVTRRTLKNFPFERRVDYIYSFETCTSLNRLRVEDIPDSKCEASFHFTSLRLTFSSVSFRQSIFHVTFTCTCMGALKRGPQSESPVNLWPKPQSQLSIFLIIPVNYLPIPKSQQILKKKSQFPAISGANPSSQLMGHVLMFK